VDGTGVADCVCGAVGVTGEAVCSRGVSNVAAWFIFSLIFSKKRTIPNIIAIDAPMPISPEVCLASKTPNRR